MGCLLVYVDLNRVRFIMGYQETAGSFTVKLQLKAKSLYFFWIRVIIQLL